MRLRHILLLAFIIAAQLPLAMAGAWMRSHLAGEQHAGIEDKHLLLARNLASTLSRYHQDVAAAFRMTMEVPLSRSFTWSEKELLSKLGFTAICTLQIEQGLRQRSAGVQPGECRDVDDAGVRAFLQAHVPLGAARKKEMHQVQVRLTSLKQTPDGRLRLYAVAERAGLLHVGVLSVDTLKSFARDVRFGAMGHAVIVDQAGQVIAHPKPEWDSSAKTLGDHGIVRAMLRGESGVMTFDSASLNGTMIAGFAGVQGAGWGVMIPQPVAELQLAVFDAVTPVYVVIGIGFALALAAAFSISRFVASPMERITVAARKARADASLTEIEGSMGSRFLPSEPRAIIEAYNGMVRTIRASEAEVRRQAYQDGVTGLLNRAGFNALARPALEKWAATGKAGMLLYVDLDDFKSINDLRGHAAGDIVLAEAARRIIDACNGGRPGVIASGFPALAALIDGGPARDWDGSMLAARFGGDEFVVMIGLPKDAPQAFADAFSAALWRPFLHDGAELPLAASVGCALFPDGRADTLDAVLSRADSALYHAKSAGKHRACIYDPAAGVRSIAEIRREVDAAIVAGEMQLYYQPKVEAVSGTVKSAEALIRWNHPVRGLIAPAAFIPHIEESASITLLGEWVLAQAARDAAAWRRAGVELEIAVNVGARQLLEPDFARRARDLVRVEGAKTSWIELEITEEVALGEGRDAARMIEQLRAEGFRIALDDFGRGYSNLARLAGIEVDTIKIDRSLVVAASASQRARGVLSATLAMGGLMSCKIVAEGVEDAAQAAMLRRLGCDELQGYYFMRPAAAAEFGAWLAARNANPVEALREKISGA